MVTAEASTIAAIAGTLLTILVLGGGGLIWVVRLGHKLDALNQSHQQLFIALSNHYHTESGRPVFIAPIAGESPLPA